MPEAEGFDLLPLTARERAEQADFTGSWKLTAELGDPTSGQVFSGGRFHTNDRWFEAKVGDNGNWISGELKWGAFYANFGTAANLVDGQANQLILEHDADANIFTYILDDVVIGETAYSGDLSDLTFDALQISTRSRWHLGESDGTRDDLNNGGVALATFTDLDSFDLIL